MRRIMIRMGERLTIEELRERYDGEWVLVVDPETDEMHEVLSGVVAVHSHDRDEMYDGMLKLSPRPSHAATLCFKELPENWALAL